MVVDVVPPRGSTHDFHTVPRPRLVPGGGPVGSATGRAGPVVPMKKEVSRGSQVPGGTGRAPVTGTSVLITVTVIGAAFELTKLGSLQRSSSLGSSEVVHPPGGREVTGTVR